MVITCPHCKIMVDTDQAAYVDEDLILCEHCGNEFLVPPDPRRDPRTAAAAQPAEPAPPPRIVVSAADAPSHPPASPQEKTVRAAHPVATFFWTLGILILLVALVGQYSYFMREGLATRASLRPWIERLCVYAGCRVSLLHAPEDIRVIARDVRRHPTVSDGLVVSVVFSNQAAFRQAYPLLQLTFFDMRDQPVAGRRFLPEEYLPRGIDISNGIPAGDSVQAAIDVVDPGPTAVNFVLDFH